MMPLPLPCRQALPIGERLSAHRGGPRRTPQSVEAVGQPLKAGVESSAAPRSGLGSIAA